MAMRAPWEMAAPMTGSTLRPAWTAELPQWQGPCRGTTLRGRLSKEAVLSTHKDSWAVKMATCSPEPGEVQRKVEGGEEEEVS